MSRNALTALFVVMVSAAAPTVAQTAPYTEGSVWELSFIRVKPGMGDQYSNDLRASWKRTMEEAKRNGVILSYKTLYADAGDRDDWNVLLMVEYRNMAALDGLRERWEPIAVKVIGSRERREARMVKRAEVRELVGERLAREFILRDSTMAAAGR